MRHHRPTSRLFGPTLVVALSVTSLEMAGCGSASVAADMGSTDTGGRAMLVPFRLHFDPQIFDSDMPTDTAFTPGDDTIILIQTSGTPFPRKWQYTHSSESVANVNTSYSFIFGVLAAPSHVAEVLRKVTLPAYLCAAMIALPDHQFPAADELIPTAITSECQAVPPELATRSATEAQAFLPQDAGSLDASIDLELDTLVRNETSLGGSGAGQKTAFLDLANFARYVYSVR